MGRGEKKINWNERKKLDKLLSDQKTNQIINVLYLLAVVKMVHILHIILNIKK